MKPTTSTDAFNNAEKLDPLKAKWPIMELADPDQYLDNFAVARVSRIEGRRA